MMTPPALSLVALNSGVWYSGRVELTLTAIDPPLVPQLSIDLAVESVVGVSPPSIVLAISSKSRVVLTLGLMCLARIRTVLA